MAVDLGIQNAFLEGINEVFSIMFTQRCNILLLDQENTPTNIYRESKIKKYKSPISLVAKVILSTTKEDNPQFKDKVTATITVPTKQLLDNEIPHTTRDDLDVLSQAVFEYDGIYYEIEKVNPKTLVADMWQIYEFSCVLPKVQITTEDVGDDDDANSGI